MTSNTFNVTSNLRSRRAVIWVSTILYIVITLAIIGIVLAAVKPRMDETRDRAAIEQTISLLSDLDETITRVDYTIGTRVERSVSIKKGTLTIDCPADNVVWEMPTTLKYSEPGKEIEVSSVALLTEKYQDRWKVILTLDYRDKLDLTFNDKDEKKTLQEASLPYDLFIENLGPQEAGDLNQINFYEV